MDTVRSTSELLGLLDSVNPVDPVSRIDFTSRRPIAEKPLFRERERQFVRDLAVSYESIRGVFINVKDAPYYALGDGIADDTASIQAAVDSLPAAGGTIYFPPSTGYRHGPITITKPCLLLFTPGSAVVPIFDFGTTQKLYAITSSDVTVDGLAVTNLAGVIGANKYLVHISNNAQGCIVRNSKVSNITMNDGNSGLTNLLVVHCFYADSGSDLLVEDNTVNVSSGAATFCRNIVGLTIRDNHFTDTRWYTVTLDSGCTDFTIENNVIDGQGANIRYWGGSINLMSQIGGTKNKRGRVVGNTITGVHNYGACIRVLSAEDVFIGQNKLYACSTGSLLGGTLQLIGIDRRGTAEGQPENGPCLDITVQGNFLTAGPGPQQGIYCKNQWVTVSDPFRNIVISHNHILSVDAVNYFESCVAIHGTKGGHDTITVAHNICSALTGIGAIVGGAIGVVSTQLSGVINNLTVVHNTIRDIGAAVPSSSSQIAIFLQTFLDGATVENNKCENFFYGIRTLAGLFNLRSLGNNFYKGCVNKTLLATVSSAGNQSRTYGAALPVSDIFDLGHEHLLPTPAAAAVPGYTVSVAGGAHSFAWAAGANYAAGLWVRNGAGRVYQLMVAGPGVTANAPAGVVVGVDETAADGYTWRCMHVASVRWVPLAVTGATVALP